MSDLRDRLGLYDVATFVTQRFWLSATDSWVNTIDKLWSVLEPECHSVFTCSYRRVPKWEQLPNSRVSSWPLQVYESPSRTDGWSYELRPDKDLDLCVSLMHDGACTVFILQPGLSLVEFTQILTETKTEMLQAMDRLLGPDDVIVASSADELFLDVTTRL